MTKRLRMRGAAVLLTGLLAGCTVGPDFVAPQAEAPAAWKGAAGAEGEIRPDWWTLFGDEELSGLMDRALADNLDLRVALSRVEQARAVTRQNAAGLYPTINASPSWTRERYSANRSTAPGARREAYTGSEYTIPFDLSYEFDVWGRVRRGIEAADAAAEATELDREGVRLTVAGDVARAYFAMRSLDAEAEVLAEAVSLRKQALEIVAGRLNAGVGNEVDVSRAQTEVATAEADLRGVRRARAGYENALAVLCGQPAPTFKVGASGKQPEEVAVPAGLPSEVLQRRPDIAAAVARMREANARVGVATAAYYPRFFLTGSAGFVSGDLGSALDAGSRVWSLGPSVSVPIFEGGRNDARLEEIKALYQEREASYRQTLLVAFREVEDSLSALGELKEEISYQTEAQRAADRTFELATGRYKQGLVTYLDVVDAARSQLDARRAKIRLRGVQAESTVLLIKALGGGWKEEGNAESSER